MLTEKGLKIKIKIRGIILCSCLLIILVCLSSILGNPQTGRAGQEDFSHQIHLVTSGGRGPHLGDRCAACHSTETPSASDVNYRLCIPCHSPDGAYDGLNDPATGARYNWGKDHSMIYGSDGRLKSNKKWCVGCHDDGSCVIQDVSAPNIAGMAVRGEWQTPSAIISSDIPGADNLLDHSLDTGNSGTGTYIIFDLGSETDSETDSGTSSETDSETDSGTGSDLAASHLRLYTATGQLAHWEVYGGNDLVSWTRIVFGQSILFSSSAWKTTGGSWNEIRLDRFVPVRYLKLVKISPWPLSKNYLLEFEVKKDLQYGYYVNGHKIGCDSCHDTTAHDTTAVHIDGMARTYRASLDNYQAGYRLNNVEVDGENLPPLEIPRTGCNNGENPGTDHDFALCFACHDKYKLLGDAYSTGDFFQDPLVTNFRNDSHQDENGKVRNEHLRHLQGRYPCGNAQDWDSDWDDVADSPQSCPACHNVHGSPSPAMTRHGELASTPGTADKAPMFNFQYLSAEGEADSALSDTLSSAGGKTQRYGSGPGSPDKNSMCNMCHPDQVTYYRTPVVTCQGCHAEEVMAQPAHCAHLQTDSTGPTGSTDSTNLKGSAQKGSAPKGPAIGCWDCHSGTPDNPHGPLFADGKPLEETRVCDTCHSPGGSYNGVDDPVIGAKNNWKEGIYQNNRLKPDKEKWCAGCHDEDPANSRADGSGVNAPAVIGDEKATTQPDSYQPEGNQPNGNQPDGYQPEGYQPYGYYKTGHGRGGKVGCTDCHDPSLAHIDHKHRTYRASLNNYRAGYRLIEINGQTPLRIRNTPPAISDPASSWQDFALCFRCHNKYELLGHSQGQGLWHKEPPFDTNFGTTRNDHYRHLAFNVRNYCDSDFDGLGDAASTCTTCHNVHGSPSASMIRHGELISPPGTLEYVPSFDFARLTRDEEGFCTFKPDIPTAGQYQVWATWSDIRRIDSSLNSSQAKYRIVHAGGESVIYRNQRENAGKRPMVWNLLGTFYFDQGAFGFVQLTSEDIEDTARNRQTPDALSYVIADAVKFVSVADGSIIVVDNEEAEFGGTWRTSSSNPKFRYYRKSKRNESATLMESIGGCMANPDNILTNHSCVGCHGQLSYAHSSLVPKTSFAPTVSSARIEPLTAAAGALSLQAVPPSQNDPVTALPPGQNDQITALSPGQSGLITAYAFDTDSDLTAVTVDLSPIGGSANQIMYDDGTHGDSLPGDHIYSITVIIPPATVIPLPAASDVTYRLCLTARDATNKQDQTEVYLKVIRER